MNRDERALHQRSLEMVQSHPREEWDARVLSHVEECASCQQTLETLDSYRDGMKRRFGRAQAPASLVTGLRESLETKPVARRPRPRFVSLRVGGALAAGLVLGFFLAPLLRPPSPIEDGEVRKTVMNYLEDVTHDRYLLERTGRPLELLTDDGSQASTWLSEGLGFDVALASTPPDGWTLEGTRVWHTVSRLSALAIYALDSHRISVFAVPSVGLRFEDSESIPTLHGPVFLLEGWGFLGVAWQRDGVAWSAVGDLDAEAMLEWVEAYRSASTY